MTPVPEQSDSAAKLGERGWFWPTQARKAHFDGGDGIALCGKWGRLNPLNPRASAPLDGDASSPPSKDDCAACRRLLERGA
jgi:hypothetical protein